MGLRRRSRCSRLLNEGIEDVSEALDNVTDKEAKSVVEDVVYHANEFIRDFYEDAGFRYITDGDPEREEFVKAVMKATDAKIYEYCFAWDVRLYDTVQDDEFYETAERMVEDLEDKYDCKLELRGRNNGHLVLTSLPQQNAGNYVIEVPRRVWTPKEAFYQLYNALDDWGYIERDLEYYDDIAELVNDAFNSRYEDRSNSEGVLTEGPWMISDDFLKIMKNLDKDINKDLAKLEKEFGR